MASYGLIHVYFGDGKGKTTAVLGLILRALGRGADVALIQFMKGSTYSGEIYSLSRFSSQLQHFKFGWTCPRSAMIKSGEAKCQKCGQCFQENRDPRYGFAKAALRKAGELMAAGTCQVMVLDEVGNALRRGLISEAEFLDFLNSRDGNTELILTGRTMPKKVLEQAHYVTKVAAVKHPFKDGVDSRRGIEY
ncbi:cob(I)yrinic acid a,c-diamide adenosyltransferase [Metallumcola ferriviriculae]|uniref:Cob(I)yrinic acid a,c-diamide adenosyltransferase n=1 Tax=Metallumcola ferriviriculae TaxID=3039180 RepID=A0AAU0UMH2_9FIRM|nr:cob(I)yrinic acid a,c-diamide adenosyltransferase [Desulfitibacteraceae bacterium MK1]